MQVPYEIVRSDRKTIAIQIKPDGTVLLRCPQRMRTEDVLRFAQSKKDWIDTHLAKIEHRQLSCFTDEEIRELREKTRQLVTRRVEYYAPIVGVSYGRIAVRAQHTRWGSCSGKGNLNFNCLLALVPAEVLDYVVVHELCHRKQLNHSPKFWAEVDRVLPYWKRQRKWLKGHGRELIARL